MSKNKQIDATLLENALNALADRAQKRLGEAGAERARLFESKDGIEVTKEWITKVAEAHFDLGAASAIIHAARTLLDLFGLEDPFKEFEEEGESKDANNNRTPEDNDNADVNVSNSDSAGRIAH